MKVLHLNTHDVLGGAARSAHRLHTGLRRIGVDSRMLVRTKHSDDADVTAIDGDGELAGMHDAFEVFHVRPQLPEGGGMFSFSPLTPDLAGHLLVQEADVIHLHWTAQYFSAECVGELAALGKPLFWTFHDLWAVTGGCHYPGACRNYESVCEHCPAIAGGASAEVRREQERKIAATHDLQVRLIAPSRWIRDAAQRSAVAGRWITRVVPYGIDTRIFRPQAGADARASLGIPEDRVCLLFGCHSIAERRKGFAELREALHLAGADVDLVIFGHESGNLPGMPVCVRSLGRLNSDEEVARAYAAADVYVCPTLQDNLPNTVMESLCCGTPVIGFATGGVPEMVEHDVSGLLAATGDVRGLADSISRFASDAALRDRLRTRVRSLQPERFSLETQAQVMLSLYREMTGGSDSLFTRPVRSEITNCRLDPSLAMIAAQSCTRAWIEVERHLVEERLSSSGQKESVKQQAREIKDARRQIRHLEQKIEDLTLHPWRAIRGWLSSKKRP